MNLLFLLELEPSDWSPWLPGVQTWTRTHITVHPTPILGPLDLDWIIESAFLGLQLADGKL